MQNMFLELIIIHEDFIIRKDERETDKLINQFGMTH